MLDFLSLTKILAFSPPSAKKKGVKIIGGHESKTVLRTRGESIGGADSPRLKFTSKQEMKEPLSKKHTDTSDDDELPS